MYFWFGLDVDNYFSFLKEKIEKLEKEKGIRSLASNLPMHISLIISKDVLELSDIVSSISSYLEKLKRFKIKVNKIKCMDDICWIEMKKNKYLEKVHEDILDILKEKYNIERDKYDDEFIYHTSLFTGLNENIKDAYEEIKNIKIPKKLYTNKILIGMAKELKLEEFKIIKEIII